MITEKEYQKFRKVDEELRNRVTRIHVLWHRFMRKRRGGIDSIEFGKKEIHIRYTVVCMGHPYPEFINYPIHLLLADEDTLEDLVREDVEKTKKRIEENKKKKAEREKKERERRERKRLKKLKRKYESNNGSKKEGV